MRCAAGLEVDARAAALARLRFQVGHQHAADPHGAARLVRDQIVHVEAPARVGVLEHRGYTATPATCSAVDRHAHLAAIGEDPCASLRGIVRRQSAAATAGARPRARPAIRARASRPSPVICTIAVRDSHRSETWTKRSGATRPIDLISARNHPAARSGGAWHQQAVAPEHLLDAAHRLAGARLILDQGEAHMIVAIVAEADSRGYRHLRLRQHLLGELQRPHLLVGLRNLRPDVHRGLRYV